MTLKESTLVAGLPQSAGIEPLQGLPARRRTARSRGASSPRAHVCLGKTNIPVALSDWQADSPVYGRTNNPWDLTRTPGGSTGGGSAALAAGMTPLEIGSDIGGSIRVPAAYCGVYGHRPSETAIPRAGAFPFGRCPEPRGRDGGAGTARAKRGRSRAPVRRGRWTGRRRGRRLAARTAVGAARAPRGLPRRRHAARSTWCQPSSAMRAKVDELATFLSDTGAKVDEAMPAIDQEAYLRDYVTLLIAITSLGQSREEREEQAAALVASGDRLGGAHGQGHDTRPGGLHPAARPPRSGTGGVAGVLRGLGCARLPDRARRRIHPPDRRPARTDADGRRPYGPLDAQHRVPDVGDLRRASPRPRSRPASTQQAFRSGCRRSGPISRTAPRCGSRSCSSASGRDSNRHPATERARRGRCRRSPRDGRDRSSLRGRHGPP